MSEKKKLDFNGLTEKIITELVANYIKDNIKTDEAKKEIKEWIKENFYSEKSAKRKSVTVCGANGQPITYVSKKTGEIKVKRKMVDVGNEKVTKFNLLKAKRSFYTRFKEDFEWVNAPKEKKASVGTKQSPMDALLESL